MTKNGVLFDTANWMWSATEKLHLNVQWIVLLFIPLNSGSDVEFDSDGLFGVLVVEHIYSRGKVTVFLLLNYLILKARPNHSGNPN